MKKIFTVLFLVSSFAFGQNGDFESWTGGVPDFWTTIDGGITVVEETTTTHGGSSSASIDVTTGSQASTDFRQDYDVVDGSIYNFSVFVNHTEGNLKVRFYIDDYHNYSTNTITGAWQEITYSYTATATETIEIGLRFYDQSGFDGAEIVYVDDFTVNGGALPVELTTFSASVVDNNVALNWETATEVNNYGFNVERASAPLSMTSPKDWKEITFVNGHGNSNSPKSYSFVDNTVHNAGKYFYRLKQVDIDGSYEYSSMVEVDLTAQLDYKLNQNFPNPFNPTTSIQFSLPEASQVKLVVFNVIGEQVAELVNKNMEAGNHNVEFNASELNSGIYVYKIEANGFVQIRKMILVK
ncbi:MAG: T9SS type A sorting domain-containing protein [Ignavibacteriae bacterium]|nr:T9SS type A sorting domain-containing protein [Ignavibacteriota bacterium]